MGNHLTFNVKTNHDELHQILNDYNVSLETYQLAQLLTRAMLFPKNGDLGGWHTSVGNGERHFASHATQLDWKKKIELAIKLIADWGNDFSGEKKTKILYGSEIVSLEKGKLFQRTTRVFESYVDVLKSAEEIETGGYKLLMKGQVIREREAMAAKVRRMLEFNKKKFVRTAMIEYDEEKELFIYHPENHPYFREWLIYNFAFWSPFFKSRTLMDLSQGKIRKLNSVRSLELVPFLAKKFRLEHWDMNDECSQEMIKKFYSEEKIGELLDNSFFRKDRLESVYKLGLIDRDIVAYSIQTWEPFKEYRETLANGIERRCFEAADFFLAAKLNKKAA